MDQGAKATGRSDMELGLKVLPWGPGAGRVVPVPEGSPLVLGRCRPEQEGVGLSLPSPSINPRHCEVWRDEGGLWLRDIFSSAGTRVNEAPAPTQTAVQLNPCDRLQVGRAVLRVVFLGQANPAWLAWQEGTVASLARGVLERGWAEQGRVLHDALLEAGCEDPDLLGHCLEGCADPKDCSLLALLLPPEGAMLVRLCWPRCDFWGGEWGRPCRDALWVECSAEEARKLIHPLLEPAAVDRSERLAADPHTQGEPTQDGQPSPRYCFLISTDLRLIDPHPIGYPWTGLWNGACPFRQVGEHRVNTLEGIAGILPRRIGCGAFQGVVHLGPPPADVSGRLTDWLRGVSELWWRFWG
jgi:hypothetical protein